MNKLIVSLFVLTGFVGFANAAGNAEAGQALTAVCAGCHAADGNSAVANFPKLAGQGEKYLVKQMQDIKSGQRAVVEMTGLLNAYSDQQLADIGAFYESQPVQVGQANADLVDLGESLYKAGNAETGVPACIGCHASNGGGNSFAGFPSLGGQHAAYTATQLVKFQKGYRADAVSADVRVNDGDAKIMRTIAFKLKDFEIEALASYIQGLH
jgi:cytochrome c553